MDALEAKFLCDDPSRPSLRPARQEVDPLVLGAGPCAWPLWTDLSRSIHQARGTGHRECENMRWRSINLAGAVPVAFAKIFGRSFGTPGSSHPGGPAIPVRAIRWQPAWMSIAGDAKNHLGSSEEAAAWFRRAIEANRNFPFTHFSLAAALAQLGRLDEAHSAVKAGLALDPNYTVSRTRASWAAMSDNPMYLAQIELYLEGLRKAGVPEQ